MTYEERQKWFCEQCRHKDDCGYKNRNMQDDCIENENFMSGWELGARDTLEEVNKVVQKYDNKSGYRFNSLYNEMKNLITKLIRELFI